MAKQKKCPPEGAPLWVVSYSDLMSLLFTFFVMLFIISSLDARKAEAVSQSLRETFGTIRSTPYIPFPATIVQPSAESSSQSNRNQTVQTIQNGNPTRALIPIVRPKDKITTGLILFENDSDTLSNIADQTLQDVYAKLRGSPMMVEIRGHTGRNERGTNRDSMDLAYARAYAVRQRLVDLGTDPARIIITSWGANRSSGTVVPSQVGVSNAYAEIFLISETPEAPASQ
jgi:chemotaxis protein MotB